MKTAKLETLGLEVPTDIAYHDDGFVDSVRGHALKLYDKYGVQLTEQNYAELQGEAFGMKITIRDSFGKKHCHIFYKKGLPHKLALEVRAHEETHALECLGHLDTLTEKILEEGAKVDFREIDDSEIRADMGSIYALFAHGMYPKDVPLINIFKIAFRVARELYGQSRQQ